MILQMITFSAVLFGVAGYTIYDVSKNLEDGTNEAGGANGTDGEDGGERTRGRD